MILLLACFSAEPPPAGSTATVAEVVQAGGEAGGVKWGAVATAVELAAGKATAAEVTLVKQEAGKQPLSIQAQRSEWDLKARSAHFEGEVVVTRGDVVMTCPVLDVVYGAKQQIQQVVATGPVVVRSGDRQATAGHAELLAESGELLLTGKPRLEEGDNALVGQKIRFYLDGERVVCEGAAGEPCSLVMRGDLGK